MNVSLQCLHEPAARSVVYCERVAALEAIFRPEVNVCVMRRKPNPDIGAFFRQIVTRQTLSLAQVVRDPTNSRLDAIDADLFGPSGCPALRDDVAGLLELFATLTGAEAIGLRLNTLDQAIRPRLHVDRLALRLTCAYQGSGTEFLENADVRRENLGPGGQTVGPVEAIQRADKFDVCLLKGELWPENSGRGAAHRSPDVLSGERRVLLTLEPLHAAQCRLSSGRSIISAASFRSGLVRTKSSVTILNRSGVHWLLFIGCNLPRQKLKDGARLVRILATDPQSRPRQVCPELTRETSRPQRAAG